jgi:hypothetical protein
MVLQRPAVGIVTAAMAATAATTATTAGTGEQNWRKTRTPPHGAAFGASQPALQRGGRRGKVTPFTRGRQRHGLRRYAAGGNCRPQVEFVETRHRRYGVTVFSPKRLESGPAGERFHFPSSRRR